MQRRSLSVFAFVFGSLVLGGCGQQEQKPVVVIIEKPKADEPAITDGAAGKSDQTSAANPTAVPLTPQLRYESAISAAYRALAEKNEDAALASFLEAQSAIPNEFVKSEIARLQARHARKLAAERTADDIQTVLASGNAKEAAKLLNVAFEQYGDSDLSERLTSLKRQADALLSSQTQNETEQRRFLEEAEAARQAKNYRAALLSFEQAAANGVDVVALKPAYDELRDRMAKYDDLRRRAAEMRRDPSRIDDALYTLEQARQAWDTPQVAQEIDECKLALANRRDRLAVADFEVVGDVGLPLAGRTVAEEILPYFKGRFDIVERSQVAAIVQDLKIEAGDLNTNEAGRTEFGRVAKARYLVVGSVSRLYGVSVNARLVDVQTGLIVQTAKVVAASPAELSAKLPLLAKILQMTDEQKIAHERELAAAATIAPPPTTLPPAPIVVEGAVEPIVVYTPRPPEFGQVVVEDFGRIPPPAQQQTTVVIAHNAPSRDRAFFVAVELGDNLYRRGCYAEAMRHFEFALALSPGREEVLLRINNCRPHLPPAPVVLVKPRLAVLPFAELGAPGFVPPGTGVWTANSVAPYFQPAYDVVDPGEVFWWMGRLGLTVRDVVVDPSARLLLGRAIGVRFFLMGNLADVIGAGYDANAQLVDAEFNALVGSGRIRVHNHYELKLRLAELAQLTLLPPAQWPVAVEQTVVVERQIEQASLHIGKGRFQIAIGIYKDVLVRQPNNVQARCALIEAERRRQLFELEQARQAAYEAEQARIRAEQERQRALAEEARRQATVQVAVDVQALGRHQQQAHVQLLVQARDAARGGNFALSVNFFESALAMNRSPEVVNELATVRARAAEAERQRVAREETARQEALRQEQARQAETARQALIAEREKKRQAEAARREAEEAQANAAYGRLTDQAQQAKAKGDYAAAVSALQTAKTLKPSAEIEQLVAAALMDQAKAEAEKKGAAEKQRLEQQLALERKRREQAEIEATKNRAKYEEAMKLARAAMKERRFDVAKQQFQLASITQRTDEAVLGLRQVEDEIAKDAAAAEAAKRAEQEKQAKAAERARLLAEARKAADARNYDAALQTLQAAVNLDPANVETQAEVVKVKQARDDQLALARKQKEEQERKTMADQEAVAAVAQAKQKADQEATKVAQAKAAAVAQAIQRARDAIKANNLDAAVAAIADGGRIDPSHPDLKKVQQELADARNAFAAAQKAREAELQKQKLQALLAAARQSITAKQFDAAEKSLTEARALSPQDPALVTIQKEIADGRARQQADAEAARRKQQHDDAIKSAQAALAAGKFDEATRLANEARKVAPNDPAAQQIVAQAGKAKAEAANAAIEAERTKNYNAAMGQAQAAMQSKQYAQAADLFGSALKAKPNDPKATQGLNQARAALNPPKVETPKIEPPKKETPKVEPPKVDPAVAAYNQNIIAARTAFAQKNYAGALQLATEAQKYKPNDGEATKIISDSRAALTPPKKEAPKFEPPPPPKKEQPKADPNALLSKLLETGQALENQGNYADALANFVEAAKLQPGNAVIRRKADFNAVMAAGIRALNAGQKAEAIQNFERAVQFFPTDGAAKRYLAIARDKK